MTRHSKPMKEVVPGDNIYFRDGQIWSPAVITNIDSHPQSYYLQTPNGQIRPGFGF